MLQRIVPWAVGIEATYRHEMGRPILAVEPGEWPLVELSPVERARYVGVYDEEGAETEVWAAGRALRVEIEGRSGGVLRSKRAIQVNIAIMRAFVAFRAMLAAHKDLADKLAELEQRYDKKFRVVF